MWLSESLTVCKCIIRRSLVVTSQLWGPAHLLTCFMKLQVTLLLLSQVTEINCFISMWSHNNTFKNALCIFNLSMCPFTSSVFWVRWPSVRWFNVSAETEPLENRTSFLPSNQIPLWLTQILTWRVFSALIKYCSTFALSVFPLCMTFNVAPDHSGLLINYWSWVKRFYFIALTKLVHCTQNF